MHFLKSYILFVFVFCIALSDTFSQSFSFTYSGPTSVTAPFGQNSTAGTYYFQYSREGTLIRPRLTVFLDGTLLTQGICEGADAYTPSSYTITFTPGNHTVKFTLSDLGKNSNDCTQATIWQTVEFNVNCKYTVKIQNPFAGGTVYVDNYYVAKQAPYYRSANNSENILLGAIEQSNSSLNWIWNTSGTNNSNWMIKRYLANPQSFSTSQNTSYTTLSGDKDAEITANLRAIYHPSFQNNFVGISNGGNIKINGNTLNAPATTQVVEGNDVIVEAPDQVINGILYTFMYWDEYNTQNPRTYSIYGSFTATAYYKGKPIPTPNVSANSNIIYGNPIKIIWDEHPNVNVTQYYLYRKVKHSKYYSYEGPTLLATLPRGTRSYTDYDYFYTNGYTDDLLWYDVRAYYSTEQTFADSNYTATFGNNGAGIMKANDVNSDKIFLSKNAIPEEYSLAQNYPNPFNPTTVIKYDIKKDGFVTIKVYDLLGRVVATLVNEEKAAGYYTVNFDAGRLSSGIYFYTIKSNDFFDRKKMILLR